MRTPHNPLLCMQPSRSAYCSPTWSIQPVAAPPSSQPPPQKKAKVSTLDLVQVVPQPRPPCWHHSHPRFLPVGARLVRAPPSLHKFHSQLQVFTVSKSTTSLPELLANHHTHSDPQSCPAIVTRASQPPELVHQQLQRTTHRLHNGAHARRTPQGYPARPDSFPAASITATKTPPLQSTTPGRMSV